MRAATLALLMGVAAGCGESPAAPLEVADAGIQSVQSTSAIAAGSEASLSLEGLLKAALEKHARENGKDAVRALTAALDKLNAEYRAAANKKDAALVQRIGGAIRAEQVAIVLKVMGDEVAGRVVEGATQSLTEVERSIAAAKAAGRNVLKLEPQLATAKELLARARAALAERAYPRALDLGSQAAVQAAQLRFSTSVVDGSYTVIPTVDALWAQAAEKVGKEKGKDAARALGSTLQPLRAAMEAAGKGGDRAAAAQAAAAYRAEQVRIIVSVLGASAAQQVIDATAKVQAEIAAKVTALPATTKDGASSAATLERARTLLAAAKAALAGGKVAEALDLALQSGGLSDSLRATLARR